MNCDKCEDKVRVRVRVELDIYDERYAKSSFITRAWWCPRCVNNGEREATRITIAALEKRVRDLGGYNET